jgi:serine/threonine protein kinase
MAPSAGTRLGPYEVLAPLGSGGMGEVYRARDTKLGRDVALKVLPDSLAHDADRLARFVREAHLLAALNHPHIAHIHGFEDSTGTPALVMELVEGPTLADRIAQGAIPIEEALPIAKQIAEALEAAHEQGIIHRDLKPANIKIRADGTVKVLDFGLAKAFDSSVSSSAGATMSPTLSIHATQAGVILGTAAYMAPEQARGKAVDRRADIWAFGCVLFEMLAGRRAFDGDDISVTLASVLKTEPDWTRLPPATPAGLRRLLGRCLKKDAKDRLQAIGDARVEITEWLSGVTEPVTVTPIVPTGRLWRRALPVAAGVLITATVIGAMGWFADRRAPDVARLLLGVQPADELFVASGRTVMALSPDGRYLVFTAFRNSRRQLYLRTLDRLEATPLAGTEDGDGPFFHPTGDGLGSGPV